MQHVNLIIDNKLFNTEAISKNSISVSKFSVSIESKKIFDDSSLKISKGIYSLVGKNGCGKSTFLQLLKYRKLPINPDWNILYLEQEIEDTIDTPFEVVMKSNDMLNSLKKRRDYIIQILEEDPDNVDDMMMDEMTELDSEINTFQEVKQEIKVKKILLGLGFDNETMNQPSNIFSGGWKRRISLARVLYIQPDVLLMDEPTNHLDLEAIIWLTEYLTNYNKNKIIILVSHNIGFLNNISDYIMNIENNMIHSYRGNYDSFKKNFSNKKREIQKKYNAFMKKVKKLKKKGTKKREIDEMMKKEGIVEPEKESNSKIEFFNYKTDDNNIVVIDDVTFGYKSDKLIFDNINFGIRSNSKIVLVGENGSGKSTLLKIISGDLQVEGIHRSNKIKIGVYDQQFENTLPMDKSPVEYLAEFVPDDFSGQPHFIARSYLGKVKLEPKAHLKKIGELSGGMKARVAIVKLIFSRPHLLIMDEPTNHLDIETVECLINALVEFEGAFMVITHESHLIESMEEMIELFLIENKKVKKFRGDFNEYSNKIINRIQTLNRLTT
tara:strand:+ start:478 stop:2133 length:1656 start_codon:yes stop_codon:yes gene_type:complete